MRIDDAVALITGGASGLGAGVARRFIDGGARVLIVDRDAAKGEALAESLGDACGFAKADVVNADEIDAALDVAEAAFGGLNALLNCAGIGIAMRTTSSRGPHPLEAFEQVLRVNLIGTFNAIRLAAQRMAANPPGVDGERGVIINTASVAAYDGQIGQAAYSASKGGIVGMTLPIARDLARDGIRVCTIAPGIFDTPLLGQLPDAARQSLERQTPFPLGWALRRNSRRWRSKSSRTRC